MFKPDQPYNELPLLPPKADLETKTVFVRLVAARTSLAKLDASLKRFPNPDILIHNITLSEAKDSSEIENIFTTQDELYLADSNGSKKAKGAAKEVISYREALWKGFNNVVKKGFLATNTFVDIVQAIKKNTGGIRKTPGTKIVNERTGEIIYTPPEGETLIREKLGNLEKFLNDPDISSLDPLVKMAVGHYQFEAIHPFTDGNGRTGRIINILYLISQGILSQPVIYLSRYIIEHKNSYYQSLRDVTVKNEWEKWVVFNLDAIEAVARGTEAMIGGIYDNMDKTHEELKKVSKKRYSREFIEAIYEKPYIRIEELAKKTGAVRQTASAYLKDMEKLGVLRQKKFGRDVIYINTGLIRILKKKDVLKSLT
jgi:Fic family protein